ncbi:uncharacterized protein HMPREF1541_00652 [Cyphellophora europaea CBS 101466]|uniref:CBM20 domain-containing protein n=1 Tax=Cyphellophora europaea (strain CBS 101466) TaxID=1220924 RepID=W2SCP9_CYPE1|nr:uncharacterized protein HMPREF1541_00652 [Cyphellophora europaea CBS 101466]ETN46467.1 hypothetical protein HMPREF1541_00652 [Cyphellophora europaea CBS 101466]
MWSPRSRGFPGLGWLCLGALSPAVSGLTVEISVADDLLPSATDGRVMLMFAPVGTDPLDDTDVVTSPNLFFGKNLYQLTETETASLEGGSGDQPRIDVWGFPNISLDDVAPGEYTVQAFFNPYEIVTRADGSVVSVHFPCGDGAEPVDGPGSLTTEAINISLAERDSQTIQLTFDNVTATEDFTGTEIGGCSQGNYEDLELLKYVKIRSELLSDFWNRDMYIGANVLLPAGYDANDSSTLYPVIYHQGHWPGESGAYGYPDDPDFVAAWDNGTLPNTTTPAPQIILVTFRHETAFYDDSYAVNTANLGPYGDAINDELIPHLESLFHMNPHPYARIQDGGSTGGWESAANLIFRPDLFGACFSSYPDSLSFRRHQDIPLYNATNAYTNPDGSKIYSIREVVNDTLTDVTTVEQENHWELSFGTSSRSALQWDVWNAVFGVQGYNHYPLEPWDKVTGDIYPEAVEYWRSMDLAEHITSNWDNALNLGEALKGRIFVYVGSWDNYFLNEGVAEFQAIVDAKGGAGWANVTILEGEEHGGVYQLRDVWDYLQLVEQWVTDHAPDGQTPLADDATSPSSRGNLWADVLARGGREAALARQAPPAVALVDGVIQASVGRWDPGVALQAQWLVNGTPSGGAAFAVAPGENVTYTAAASSWTSWRAHGSGSQSQLQLQVTGRKRGYEDETRTSDSFRL